MFYGWIDREKDSYKDFVVIEFDQENKEIVRWDTSSARYSEQIADLLGTGHSKCHRVEEKFSIENMIELE